MIMEEILMFTQAEREKVVATFKSLRSSIESGFSASDYRFIKDKISQTAQNGGIVRDNFGFNPIVIDLLTAHLVGQEIGFQSEIMICITDVFKPAPLALKRQRSILATM